MSNQIYQLLAEENPQARLTAISLLPIEFFEKVNLDNLRALLKPYGSTRKAKKAELIDLLGKVVTEYRDNLRRTMEGELVAAVDGIKLTPAIMNQLIAPETPDALRIELLSHAFNPLAESTIVKTELPRLRARVKLEILTGADYLLGFQQHINESFKEMTDRVNITTAANLMERRESRTKVSLSCLEGWVYDQCTDYDYGIGRVWDIVCVLALCTGRRVCEIVARTNLRLADGQLLVSNLAKKDKIGDAWDGVEIDQPAVFLNPDRVLELWNWVRAVLADKNLADLDYRELNNRISKPLSRVTKPANVGAAKDFRDLFVAVAVYQGLNGEMDPSLWATRALGHGLPGDTRIDSTSLNYTKFMIVD